jgi:secreted Zn-dependent insulinase-like peptidase
VPNELWSQFKDHIDQSDRNFDRIVYFGFKEVEQFDLITNCQVPSELTPEKHIKAKEMEANHTMANRNVIDMEELNRILFNSENTQQAKIQKMLVIRALLVYKICLINEFDADDEEIFPKEIFSSSRMKVYHKLYRKTLQPKTTVKIMIENPFLNEGLIKGTAIDKQLSYIKASLLCLYVKNYLSIKFRKEFTKGNDFSMGTNGFAISMVFMGISSALPDFMNLMLESLEVLLKPELYDEIILETIRQQIANNYSSFDTMTSLKLSTFYLDLMVDQLEIDYRTLSKQEMLKQWVYSVTSSDLANFYHTLQSGNKLTILFVGNIDEDEALKLTEKAKVNLLKDLTSEEKEESKEINSKETINTILDNILMRFKNKTVHYMIRKPDIDMEDNNNVYLTYFRAARSSVKVNIISNIIAFWLKNYVFDKLRNQMNLGYVAHASTREYYYRTGIIILVQGENFRPADIEKDIEETVLEFIEQLKEKSEQELDDIKMLVVEKYTEFSNSLSDVTSKEWEFIESAYILGEKTDYEKVAMNITKEDVLEFAMQTFIHKQKRITVELFAHGLTEDEHRFQLLPEDALGGLEYEIRNLDEVMKIRDHSVEYFERKLKMN